MTTTIDLPAPPGAVKMDTALENGARLFWHTPLCICDGDATLTIEGVQYPDGVTSRAIVVSLEDTWVARKGCTLTVEAARQLAAMLQNLADTCEILDETAKR